MQRYKVELRLSGFEQYLPDGGESLAGKREKVERTALVYVTARNESEAVNHQFVMECRERLMEGIVRGMVRRQAYLCKED